MMRFHNIRLSLLLAGLAGFGLLAGLHADDQPKPTAQPETPKATASVKAKPLSDQVKKGIDYLIEQQKPSGGWGQGGGWRVGDQGGRVEGAEVADPPDVASTCMATLALLRAGHTPKQGAYAKNVVRAVQFICGHVEGSDSDSIYVTKIKGTQVQSKIGPFVDTFLTALVLAEVKGQMPTTETEKRLTASLDKTIAKIEKNQKDDGSFAGNGGWAPVFSQGLASKGLNRARQNGARVSDESLAKAENNAVASIDVKAKSFKSAPTVGGGVVASAAPAPATTGAGRPRLTDRIAPAGGVGGGAAADAGVAIYNISNQTAALQEAANTLRERAQKAKDTLENKNAPAAAKEQAKQDLDRFGKLEAARKVAVDGVVKRLDDKQFVQGFGSNGGEEFLSYLNISETLVVQGGDEWQKWDKSVSDNLNRIQNGDGSWSGHHCITGKTFCTSAALMVLMADRTPMPVASKMKDKK
jgi:hypothetical protein